MALALNVPGNGWKAATIDATRPAALAIAPLAPLILLLNQSKKLYKKLWPFVERNLCIAEQPLDQAIMRDWHTYTIDWQINQVQLSIDQRIVLSTSRSPRGPMGFVAWIDNQYAAFTPEGKIAAPPSTEAQSNRCSSFITKFETGAYSSVTVP